MSRRRSLVREARGRSGLPSRGDGAPAESMWGPWNCFDYTHPNMFGLEAMGNLVDLELFRPVQSR